MQKLHQHPVRRSAISLTRLARRLVVVGIACAAVTFGAHASTDGPEIDGSETSLAEISNAHLRVNVDDDGQFVISTTGGNPATTLDDQKSLTYIYFPGNGARIWSSESWVRIVDGQQHTVIPLAGRTPVFGPIAENGKIQTSWVVSDVLIRQNLSFMSNPFSGRDELVLIDYETRNLADKTRAVGVSTVIDVIVGANDAAPFFVSADGRVTNTQRYSGTTAFPGYFMSFESPTFESDSLKAMGLLSGYGLTRPDVLSIGSLSGIRSRNGEAPDLIIGESTTDSAFGLVWHPRTLRPNTSATMATAYGLAGAGGGVSWLVAPVQIQPGQLFAFEIQAWINNASDTQFRNGTATLQLPPGLSLQFGETASKSIRSIDAHSAVQMTWRVKLDDPERVANYGYQVETYFQNGDKPLVASGNTVVGTFVRRMYLPLMSN